MAITSSQTNKVIELYSAYFNRASDSSGLNFWKNSFEQYSSVAPSTATETEKETFALQKIVIDMATSIEYKGIYPEAQVSTNFVNAIYTNLLNRSSDAGGLAFWSGHIDNKTMTKEEAILKMIEGAKANTTAQGKLDAQLIVNKTAVSKYFAETLKSNDFTLAKGAFTGVTSDPATVSAAETALNDAVNPGTTFVLTTGVDVGAAFTGTANNDTFVGTASATNPTITLGDALDGGTGLDTLKIITNLASIIPAIVTQNIEQYVITNSGNGEFTLSNQSTLPATMTFLGGNNHTFTLNGLETSQVVALELEAGQLTLNYNNISGANDAISISLNHVAETASLHVAGIENITLQTQGADSMLTNIVGASLKQLTLTGDQALKITTALANTITTVDASGMSEKISLSIAAGGEVNLTAGQANDTLTVAGLEGNDTITGGAGIDTLKIVADVSANDVANVTQVEILEYTTATTQDLSLLNATGIKTFKFADTVHNTDATYSKNDSSFTHIMSEKTSGVFTATMATNTNADRLNIELWNSDLTTLNATDYEVINLKSSVGTALGNSENRVTSLTKSIASTLVITGKTDLTLTNALAQGTVDGTAFTGKLTVTTSSAADTLKGGTNNDSLTGGGGVDTFTGNAGNDKFMTLSVVDLNTTLGNVTDVITDFTTGTNTLGGLGVAGSNSNYFEDNTPVLANLTALLALAETKLDGTIKYYAASINTDTYLVVDNDGTGYTDVVKLIGTTLNDLDVGSITV